MSRAIEAMDSIVQGMKSLVDMFPKFIKRDDKFGNRETLMREGKRYGGGVSESLGDGHKLCCIYYLWIEKEPEEPEEADE